MRIRGSDERWGTFVGQNVEVEALWKLLGKGLDLGIIYFIRVPWGEGGT